MSDLLATAARYSAACPGLELELRTDTQWATAYLGDRPFCTVQRKRMTDRSDAPRWQAYGLDGKRFAHANLAGAMVRLVCHAAGVAQALSAAGFSPLPQHG